VEVSIVSETEPRERARRVVPMVLVGGLVVYGGYRVVLAHRPYEWSGTVEARTISVGSRAGGRIREIQVREGDRVTAGQPLLLLEPGDLEAQRLVAQGQLDQAQANLEKTERGARPEEIEAARARSLTANAALQQTVTGPRREQISAAEARLKAADVAVDKAKLDNDRIIKLFTFGASSQAERDNAAIALQSAIAQRDASHDQLDELRNGARREELAQAQARAAEARASERLVTAGSRIEDIKAARGQTEAAQGRLDQIKVLIDELTVRAPRAARVEALDLRPGDIVAPNATCATLLEEDQLYVRIYVPETQIGHIHPGQEVPVTVDSFPDHTFKGVVEHVNSVGEYSPRNLQTADERADQVFAARIGLRDNASSCSDAKGPCAALRAGMAAFITVPK
jgi:HlyD family secretion protein